MAVRAAREARARAAAAEQAAEEARAERDAAQDQLAQLERMTGVASQVRRIREPAGPPPLVAVPTAVTAAACMGWGSGAPHRLRRRAGQGGDCSGPHPFLLLLLTPKTANRPPRLLRAYCGRWGLEPQALWLWGLGPQALWLWGLEPQALWLWGLEPQALWLWGLGPQALWLWSLGPLA